MSKLKATGKGTSKTLALRSDDVSPIDVLDVLKKELTGLRVISETPYKTGSKFTVEGFSIPLQEEVKLENLIKMHSSAVNKEDAYNRSCDKLGIKTCPVFKNNGHTAAEIEHDIELRIKVITVAERKAELEGYLKEAEGFLTKQDQFSMLKAKIAATVSK